MSGLIVRREKSRPPDIWTKTIGRRYRGELPYRLIGITLLLAFITVSSSMVMDGKSVDAEPPSSGDCGGGLEWKYNGSGTITITIKDTSYTGYMTDFTAGSSPWNAYADQITLVEITGYTARIGDYAFYNLTKLIEVHITDLEKITTPNLVSIGDHAFDGCKSLNKIDCSPDSIIEGFSNLISIGDYAFYGCNFIDNMKIPDRVRSIGSHAFEGCFQSTSTYWRHVDLSADLETIGDYAFYGCKFHNSLTITSKVETIGSHAFDGCRFGYSLYLTDANNLTTIGDYAFYECEFGGGLTIPSKVKTIGDYAFTSWNVTEYYAQPLNISKADSLTTIGNYAFSGGKFNGNLNLPGSVTTIGDHAFSGCTFDGNLNLLGSVTTIGDYAFSGCKFTGNLTIPSKVKSIGDYTFSGCKFTGDLTIPDTVETIGDYAFSECYQSDSTVTWKLTLSNNLTTIGNNAFYKCKFTGALIIPDKVETIGDSAFNGCDFDKSLTLCTSAEDSKLKYIGEYAFNGCKFSEGGLTIPSTVTTIGKYTFSGCKFTGALTIPNTVETIGDYAFSECAFDGSLTLTDSITNIGEYAFYKCGFINSLTLPHDLTSINKGVFKECNFTGPLYIPNGVKNIDDEAFLKCDFDGTLYLPNDLMSIGSEAFNYCSFTGSLHIPAGITEIKNRTFAECKFTGPLTIPEGVTYIGDFAFEGYKCKECDLILPNSLLTLGDRSFFGCEFNKLFFPNGTINKTSGESPFHNCIFKGGLEFGENVNSIPRGMFGHITFGGCLVIPDHVRTLGHYAFTGSTFEGEPGKNHIISDNVNFIGDGCFQDCWMKDGYGGLGHLQLSRNVTFFGEFAFFSSHLLIDEIILAPGVVFEGDGYTRQFFQGPGIDKMVVMTTSLPDDFYFSVPTLYMYDGQTPINNLNSDEVYLHIFTSIDGRLTQRDPIITHTVSYNTDGGSKSGLRDSQYYEGETITLAAYGGTKEGYSFAAWTYNNEIYLPGEKCKMGTGPIEFKAVWEPAYKVIYYVNGGSTKGPETEQYKPGTIVTVQGYNGSKSGCSFNGWNWNGNIYREGDQITISDRNVVLSANWAPMYKVTYDINGGSGTAPTQEDLLEGSTFTVKSYSGTKTGYQFDGWISNGKIYQAGDTAKMGKKDITLMAVWTRLHRVTYELNGGEGDVPKQSDVAEGYTFTVKACTATMEGHVFKGWSYDRLLFQEGDIITMELDDIVLKATWEKGMCTHKVTYDLQGGSGEAPIQADVPEGSTFIVKAYSGTKEGYKFGGWLYDSKVYMMGATIKMGTEDIVLQAVWNSGEPEDDDSSIRMILMIAGAAVGGLAVIGGVAFIFLRRF